MSDTDDDEFARLLEESEGPARQRPTRTGDSVRGRIVALGAGTAFVALGGKAEAVIDLAELTDPTTGEPAVAVGDEVEATVTDDGSKSGQIVLRRTIGRGGGGVAELEQAMAHGLVVEGVVSGQNKGGFEVQIAGVRAFCPSSQIDTRRGDPAEYVGQRLRFKVSRVESGGRNVVVSRRRLLDEEAAAAAAATWQRLQVGAVVQGTVSSIRDFGAFVDLGGVDGLIHVSELAHGRPAHPSEILEVGQQVEVQVVKLEPEAEGGRGRVGLSLRALAPDPWATAAERFPVGSTVRGRVKRLESFGAFIELAPGLEGLAHVSRLTLGRRISHPRQVVNPEDEVEVTVVGVEPEKRRLSLSMVEGERRQREQLDASEQAATDDALRETNRPAAFGTLADLLRDKRGK
jgi:small subunit ribosomal protein S1